MDVQHPSYKQSIMDEGQKFLDISETFGDGIFNATTETAANHSPYASIDFELFEKYYRNRAIPDTAYWSLIVSYSLLIIAGSLGNLLVILAVVNNKSKYVLYPL